MENTDNVEESKGQKKVELDIYSIAFYFFSHQKQNEKSDD